ncbi:MAG TPA: DUF1003 domain-containing protein [Polyangiaceae bacterium]|nr:DUF1003 domain-containing protein [Polyangiaceae bacterium]
MRIALEYSTLLGSLNLFESLAESELEQLSSRLELVEIPEGALIFAQGDKGGRLYIIKEGLVDISHGEGPHRVRLATLAPGQYFGELSLFDGEPRSAAATASRACKLLALDREDFVEFTTNHPEATLQIAGELAARLRQMNAAFSGQVTRNVLEEQEEKLTLGERVADRVAAFGGSWPFIGVFALGMAVWMSFNAFSGHAFDVYPFILLNLILSTLAAIQAPVIMMSQNRQAAKDKLLAANDYEVNLKSELGIQALIKGQTEMLARIALLEKRLHAPSRRPFPSPGGDAQSSQAHSGVRSSGTSSSPSPSSHSSPTTPSGSKSGADRDPPT